MSDGPPNDQPQGPGPQNPYAQGVPGSPSPYGQPPAQPGPPASGHQPPAPSGPPPFGQQPPASWQPAPGGGFPPAPGGYPPPPGQPGGYGPPGYPTAPGLGSPYGYGQPYTAGESVRFAWNAVFANIGPWLLVALIFLGVNLAWNALTGGFANWNDLAREAGNDFSVGVAYSGSSIVWSLLGAILGYAITAVYVRGSLAEADGRRPGLGQFFQIPAIGHVLLAALLVSVMVEIGTVLCILPGIAAMIFSVFTLYFVIDRQQNAIQAIGSSFSLVAKNFGAVFVLLLAFLGINILGVLACGLGLLVTIPMSYVALGHAYRRLAPAA